jgi:hypothetical protein
MTDFRPTARAPMRLAALVLAPLALALAGCGSSAKEQVAATYCPSPLTVQDASHLTRFKPGPGRDPRDVMFEASLVNAGTACSINKDRMEVDLKMQIAVNAGPSVASGAVTSVPYFVRVFDSAGNVRQGQDFDADFKLSTANPRGQSIEELSLTLPFANAAELGSYRIAVGLKPTPEELQYNRRAAAR